MNETTTNNIPEIIDTLNGYVIIPLATLESLEDAETKAVIAKRTLEENRLSSYDMIDVLRAVFNAYPLEKKEADE